MFENAYQGTPSWEIGAPHEAIVRAACSGWIAAPVLDVGCGTGEDALYLASIGLAVTGADFVAAAIDRARAKAWERHIAARFVVADALRLDDLRSAAGERFATALDVGLFHSLQPEQRPAYVAGLERVLRPDGAVVLLCWSDRNQFGRGPARISQADIRTSFAAGWTREALEEARLETRLEEGTVHAWLARIRHARAHGATPSAAQRRTD